MTFTPDEQMMVMLYSPGNRLGLLKELNNMKTQLTPSEKVLVHITESVIKKVSMLTDSDFDQLDFFPKK